MVKKARFSAAERREIIRGMSSRKVGRDITGNMSFVDRRTGETVIPSRAQYEDTKRSEAKHEEDYKEAVALNKQYSSLISQYGKDSEQVYNFESAKLGMHRTKGRLEGELAIIGLVGGIFFLLFSITGNAIGMSKSTGSVLGVVLLCVGLIGSFFWIKSTKK